jgi:hypothetical protein
MINTTRTSPERVIINLDQVPYVRNSVQTIPGDIDAHSAVTMSDQATLLLNESPDELKQFYRIGPIACCRIRYPTRRVRKMGLGRGQYGFFLEFDRGTMRADQLRAKLTGYHRYRASGHASRRGSRCC